MRWISIPGGLEGRTARWRWRTFRLTADRTTPQDPPRSTRLEPVRAASFQGRKEYASGRNGGTARGTCPWPIGGRWKRRDQLGAPGQRGRSGRHHVHRERAVRQAASQLARLGRDRRAPLHRGPQRGRDQPGGHRSRRPDGRVPRRPNSPQWRPAAAMDGSPSPIERRPVGATRTRRRDLSLRLRRRRRRHRRGFDIASRRRDRGGLHPGPGVHHPSQRRALSERRPGRPGGGARGHRPGRGWVRLSDRRRPACEDPALRPAGGR